MPLGSKTIRFSTINKRIACVCFEFSTWFCWRFFMGNLGSFPYYTVMYCIHFACTRLVPISIWNSTQSKAKANKATRLLILHHVSWFSAHFFLPQSLFTVFPIHRNVDISYSFAKRLRSKNRASLYLIDPAIGLDMRTRDVYVVNMVWLRFRMK